MTISKILITFGSLLLCGMLSAQTTTYYTDAVNGSDTTNNGKLPSAAFKSMTKASSVMQKGDTLVVLPGTYDINIEGSFPVRFGHTSTDQAGITIIAAEGPSKTFIDGGNSYSGIGMIRFQEKARGARFSGFTFKRMADAFWSCGIRLGSTTGDAFRAWDVEIDNCVFDSTLSRSFVVFGASATTRRQTTGLRIHNNLFLNMNPNRRSVAIYGDGDNHFYNNTIIHPTTTTNRAAIYLNALLSHGVQSKAVIQNNIIIGGGGTGTDNSWGIEKGPKDTNFAGGALATVEYNNSFGNKVNYQGFVPSKTNVSVDPQFVDQSKDNVRLKSTSPMIDAGTSSVPLLRHDPDYSPQFFASKTALRVPDIGAYEYHTHDMALVSPPKLGGTLEFGFTGPTGGLAAAFVGLNEIAVPIQAFGMVLTDGLPGFGLFLLGTTSSPGNLKLTVPNVSSAEGIRTVFQGIYSGTGGLEMLNVRHSYIRK